MQSTTHLAQTNIFSILGTSCQYMYVVLAEQSIKNTEDTHLQRLQKICRVFSRTQLSSFLGNWFSCFCCWYSVTFYCVSKEQHIVQLSLLETEHNFAANTSCNQVHMVKWLLGGYHECAEKVKKSLESGKIYKRQVQRIYTAMY